MTAERVGREPAAGGMAGGRDGGWQPVIGLEIHVQLATASKLFCGDAAEFGAPPNTHVCPVCLGLPGALPVLNAGAVELALRAALALRCTVHETSIFARKHYFYPDLPKGYQITQYDRPIATGGWLELPGESESAPLARVRIRRIHLEEDAGKSLHDRFPGKTAVDLNRAGVPLIEIVTEPDLTSPAQAHAFLERLKRLIQYLGVSDCDMEKGSLRVDANVSLRQAGGVPGTPTEVKNMNSFSGVERALAFEIRRQSAELAAGRPVRHETLLWDAERGEARAMRSKEESHDYRYFPEPDLPPLVLRPGDLERARAALPELPLARERRFVEAYGLAPQAAEVLTATRELADYFEAAAAAAADPRAASNWVMGEVLGWLKQGRGGLGELRVRPEHIGELVGLVAEGTLSAALAREVFGRAAQTGQAPREIVAAEGLAQVRDTDRLRGWVDEVLSAHPAEAERLRRGEARLLGFFMGQLMKRSDGKADPQRGAQLLKERLGT